MVASAGIEPAHPHKRQILNPASRCDINAIQGLNIEFPDGCLGSLQSSTNRIEKS